MTIIYELLSIGATVLVVAGWFLHTLALRRRICFYREEFPRSLMFATRDRPVRKLDGG